MIISLFFLKRTFLCLQACRIQGHLQTSGNLCFSPILIHQALTMSYIGARYESAETLRGYLNLNCMENDAAVNLAYGDITRALTAVSYDQASGAYQENTALPYILHLASRFYLPITHCLLDQFGTALHTHYGGEIAKVPFHTDKERARQEINQWVEEATQQTVRELVQPLSLATFVSVVLASAIYFKPSWDKNMLTNGSLKVGTFHPTPGESVHVLTLSAKSVWRHGTIGEADCRVVELPFADERFALMLLLPNQVDRDALEVTESKLTGEILSRLDEFLRKSKLNVIFPKLDFNEPLSLGKLIQTDSVANAKLFARGKANFSGISGNNNLHLSHVEHKARLELSGVKRQIIKMPNATGTETPPEKQNPEMQKTTMEFNRPFIFMVRDNYLNMFLFMGCVRKPPPFNTD